MRERSVVTPEEAGWGFCGLRVLELGPAERRALATGDDELVVLPLEGACTVTADGERFELEGRESPFTAVTDFAYVPRDASLEIGSESGGRFALPSSRAYNRLEPRYGPAAGVPIELRGAAQAS